MEVELEDYTSSQPLSLASQWPWASHRAPLDLFSHLSVGRSRGSLKSLPVLMVLDYRRILQASFRPYSFMNSVWLLLNTSPFPLQSWNALQISIPPGKDFVFHKR